MPHFRRIDYDNTTDEEAWLLRAKFHIRGGKRRLREGKISLGLVTLYDALNSAMQWYVASPEHKNKLSISDSDTFNDDNKLFDLLIRAGVLDREINYSTIDDLVDMALKKDMSTYDYSAFLQQLESVMTRLGVMPFDEKDLPPEDNDEP